MNNKTKVFIAIYALAYGFTALSAFRLGSVLPLPTAYIFLALVYVIPIYIATMRGLNPRLQSLLLIVTPLLPALIVVDPLEIGFYGYDPYGTLQTAFEFRTEGPIEVARNRLSWPGFYAFLWAVTSIVGLPVASVGKYLPLIAVCTPLIFYLFVRRITTAQTAFIAAMGFAGVRTLYTFQVKFLDETPAFLLFFALLFLLAVRLSSRRSAVSYLALLAAVGAVVTHHYVGALVAGLLVLWDLSSFDLSRVEGLRNIEWPFSRLTVGTGVVFVVMFVVIAPQLVGFLISVADVSYSPSSDVLESSQTPTGTPESGGTANGTSESGGTSAGTPESGETPVGEPGSGEPSGGSQVSGGGDSILQSISGFPLRFWQLLLANIVLISLLSVVVATFRSWAIDAHRGLLVSGVFGGILALGYGYSVAFGPIIPLDPSRYLIYMTGLLLVPAGYALRDVNFSVSGSSLFAVIVVLVVLTQLALVPPGVMYSSQAHTTVDEDHYSPSQFAASDWVSAYGGDRVVGWERGLWTANGISSIQFGSTGVDCLVLRVWRQDAPQKSISTVDATLYDNGPVRLHRCS
jgi:hypothetical protein